MSVEICKKCGKPFEAHQLGQQMSRTCPSCGSKAALGIAVAIIGAIFLGLFWALPKFIYGKAGKKGVIIYFASLVVLVLGIYISYNINATIKEGQREEAREATKKVAEGAVPADITDSRDGKKYRIVKLGNQVWMAENLNYNAEGSECYDNKPGNCKQYGRLYNWETAMKACPNGWHLPSEKEWQTLVDFAGGEKVAGEKLKAKNYSGTDEFGFSALPGNNSATGGDFNNVSGEANWWTSSESNPLAKCIGMYGHTSSMLTGCKIYKNKLYLVRCIQD